MTSVHLLHTGYVGERTASTVVLVRDGDAVIVVDPGMVARFVSGQRDLRLATMGRIAMDLVPRLVEVGRARKRACGRATLVSPGGP